MAYRPADVILIDVLENAVKFSVALIHETPIAVLLRCHVFICVGKGNQCRGQEHFAHDSSGKTDEKETMPVIVRVLDDDAVTIIMVDSNL